MRFGIVWFGLKQGRTQSWELVIFFFIQAVTVLRETPKVRSIPRKLLRSCKALRISVRRTSV